MLEMVFPFFRFYPFFPDEYDIMEVMGMVKNMTAILNEFKTKQADYVSSDAAKNFVNLMVLQKEILNQIKNTYQHLTEEDRKETFEVIKRLYSIPDTVTVKDASEIIGVTVQRVRKLCAEGQLDAVQTMPGSGKWRIQTQQLMKYPGWTEYLENRLQIQKQSKDIARFMDQNLDILNQE